MKDTSGDVVAARNLRVLMRLVTVLTAVMIVGLMVVIGLMALRLTDGRDPVLPETVTVPDGAHAIAVTATADWYAVVTDANQILIFNRATGKLRQTIDVDTAGE